MTCKNFPGMIMFMKFLETAKFDWMEILNFFEKPFRAKFIPAKVWKDLDRYRNDERGLSNYVRKWRTRIEMLPCPKKSWSAYVAVGGEYDPDPRQCVMFLYCIDFDTHQFTEASWSRFKFKFMQTLMHEIIHFMQFDRRGDIWSNYVVPYKSMGNRKIDYERRYLSHFDEIQAYAHCVYLDYKMKRPNVDISTLLARCKSKKDSNTLHYILKTFNYDFTNNSAPRKVIDQIGKWDRKYKRVTK